MPQLEVITRRPTASPRRTPLLFVHGAWHGAWCWDEYFLPYFAERGFVAHALSLRGHGGSATDKPVNFARVRDYVADVEQVANTLDTMPVIVGHSMGGYVVQKYLETHRARAGVLLASLPSVGALPYTFRMLRQHPLQMLQCGLRLNLYPLVGTPKLCKTSFFSDNFPDDRANAYFEKLDGESFALTLDANLVSLPRPQQVTTPMLVLGAADDRIFPVREVEATARAYNTQPRIFPNMAHDMMLEDGWQNVADTMLAWFDEQGID
jgi:pimeloyl-ACP methyl ester carboxylesterase